MAVSIYVVSAICGCFKRESGVNPGIWESQIVPPDMYDHVYQYDNIGGFGFGQFTNTQEQYGIAWRLRDYADWCEANNKDPGDGTAQMTYIVDVEKVWYNSPQQRGSYTTIDEFLASTSTNLDDLTWDWLASWEGVPGDAFAERYAFAQDALAHIRAHENDDLSHLEWITGNFYLNHEQMLHNTLCMYAYFQGYDPGSGFAGDLQGFIDWCIAKCNDPDVGYSQQYRAEQTVGGITYYDCSSFVWYGLAHNDFEIDETGHPTVPFTTSTMAVDLAAMGFVEVDREGELKPGDIGLTADHTEVVYEGGTGSAVFMGAHTDQVPLAEQVSINAFPTAGTYYDSIWRFQGGSPGPGPEPQPGRRMPFIFFLKRII